MKPGVPNFFIWTSLCMLITLSFISAQAFQSPNPRPTRPFNAGPIGGQSISMIYSSTSEPGSYIAAHINLNFRAGEGKPRIDAFEVRTRKRSIQVYTNNHQPYVHFFEKGACSPSPRDCRQSTIPETDFVPFKNREFHGPIEARIEDVPSGRRFLVKMGRNDNILLAVDVESMRVIDGIVEVDESKPTPIRRYASWLPGVKCRPGLTCYERFHRAGLAQLTHGRIRWADGSVQKVDDRLMSREPGNTELYKLGNQRIWKISSEDGLPGFAMDRRSRLVFAQSNVIRAYPVGTMDFLQAYEKSARNHTGRPHMGHYYGYAF